MLKAPRQILKFILPLIASVILLSSCQDQPASTVEANRFIEPRLFNDEWEFTRSDQDRDWSVIRAEARAEDPPFEDPRWEKVRLPHTPRLEPRIANDQWQGFAWYRKKITPQPEWQQRRVFVDFEAAMNVAEVWFDETKLIEHLGGYLPFSAELSSAQLAEGGWLHVKLDNRDNPVTGPKPLEQLDFLTYGGLYRNVWLRVENFTHITHPVAANKRASGGIFVRYPHVSETEAEIQVQTHLVHQLGQPGISITQNLYFGGDLQKTVTQPLVTGDEAESELVQSLSLSQPKLWSPASPNLYQLETLVHEQGVLVDKQVTSIGIREFRFVDNQLYINGKKTFLRGVNRHQEYPYVGYAMSDAAQYRDAEKIKAAGFDYVRLSHYPHSDAFMQAANELGLVVLNAILGWQFINETPEFTAQVLQTCRDLIRRDRNHPSVLAWECSLNESWMQESLIDDFVRIIKEEFPGETTYSAGWQEYGYDIYLQARQHRLEHYKPPTKPYMVSEYGDWEYYAMNAGLNQDAWADLLQEARSSRQLLTDGEQRLQQQLRNIVEAHDDNFTTPAYADGYWVMFDYNRGYADDLEASGIMSLERLPKFSYYFYQSQRPADDNAGPLAGGYMVHIASHWQADSDLRLPILTNAERVEIYLNGRLLGEAQADSQQPHLRFPPQFFSVPEFEAGELKAIAFVGQQQVAEHTLVTPGEAAVLVLSLDESSMAPVAGRNDTVFVRARLLDAVGNNSRVNQAAVRFTLEGDARLLSPVEVLSEDGVASALIQLGDDLASVRVAAKYKNLKAPVLTLVK